MPTIQENPIENTDPVLDTFSAAKYLNLAPTTLKCWRSRGYGPAFLRFRSKIGYRQSALDAFIKEAEA